MSYETPALLAGCLRSLSAVDPRLNVTVVDNSVTEGCAAVARREFPHVRLLRPGNVGYGAAAALGVAASDEPFVLVLNADTEVTPGALEQLAAVLHAEPSVGLVGPRLVGPDGTPQPSCADAPTVASVLLHETGAWRLVPRGLVPRRLRARLAPFREVRAAEMTGAGPDWVLGAALAVRRTAFDAVCGFDPAFFMYYEEVDLCTRLRAAGWQIRFCPEAVVRHVGGASTSVMAEAMRVQLYRSLARYVRRHGGRNSPTGLRAALVAVAAVRGTVDVVRAAGARDGSAGRRAARGWARVAGDAIRGWRP